MSVYEPSPIKRQRRTRQELAELGRVMREAAKGGMSLGDFAGWLDKSLGGYIEYRNGFGSDVR